MADRSLRDEIDEEEWRVRVDLAACYRLAAMFGWTDLVFTHITARVPGPVGHYLINPLGLFFDEVTASNLVKISKDGEIICDPTGLGYNHAGFVIHGAVHEARPDVAAVVHLHTIAGVAVSCQAQGVLPLNQVALVIDAAYHDYEGLALDMGERRRLAANLGGRNHMVLRNHGLLTCGRTVAHAFLHMYEMQRACEIQIAAQSGGGDLVFPPDHVRERLMGQAEGVQDLSNLTARLAWPALLRRLDRLDLSYRD